MGVAAWEKERPRGRGSGAGQGHGMKWNGSAPERSPSCVDRVTLGTMSTQFPYQVRASTPLAVNDVQPAGLTVQTTEMEAPSSGHRRWVCNAYAECRHCRCAGCVRVEGREARGQVSTPCMRRPLASVQASGRMVSRAERGIRVAPGGSSTRAESQTRTLWIGPGISNPVQHAFRVWHTLLVYELRVVRLMSLR